MSSPGQVPDFDNAEFRAVRIAAPLRQSVVESLRTAIGIGKFRAGERLVERELCELIGVSRTLVREALRQLESEGLVTVVAHRGPMVAQLSLKQARDLYQVRRELEGFAAELFVQNAAEQAYTAVAQALQALKATVAGNDRQARLAAKNGFYAALMDGAGNETLAQSWKVFNSRITILRATSMGEDGRWSASISELEVLVKAINARDAVAARQAARFHVSQAADFALKHLEPVPDEEKSAA